MICTKIVYYRQQTYIRSEHVIRILLAFSHQGFPSPAIISDQNIVSISPVIKKDHHHQDFCIKCSSSCSHIFLCKMFSPVVISQGGLRAANTEIYQIRCGASWQKGMWSLFYCLLIFKFFCLTIPIF